MTPYQVTALRFVCYLGEETVRPRFSHMIHEGSLVLTVNSGYE